jgi:protein-S-isoprenylcysteine O-methyltransferase Ste14
MTTSASTPRLRLTQGLFAALLLISAVSGGRALEGLAGLFAQAAGFLLVLAGTLWRLWASVFIAGRKDAEVVRDGPYARCRHPLYLGSLVVGLGLGLATRSAVLSLAVPLLLALALAAAIRREERYLLERHGEAWRQYQTETPALWPRLGMPATMASRPVELGIYRKAFLDAAAVLTLWMLIVLVDGWRMLAAWPTLFRLP